MNGTRRALAVLAFAAMIGAGLWVVSSPAEAVHDMIVSEAMLVEPGASPGGSSLESALVADDIVFAKSIKDPACKKPCRPFVKTKTGLTCVFVGCFTETGECAYRC